MSPQLEDTLDKEELGPEAFEKLGFSKGMSKVMNNNDVFEELQGGRRQTSDGLN